MPTSDDLGGGPLAECSGKVLIFLGSSPEGPRTLQGSCPCPTPQAHFFASAKAESDHVMGGRRLGGRGWDGDED